MPSSDANIAASCSSTEKVNSGNNGRRMVRPRPKRNEAIYGATDAAFHSAKTKIQHASKFMKRATRIDYSRCE
ncbi:unnamed protein product, partial [Iphiclides podalirius]